MRVSTSPIIPSAFFATPRKKETSEKQWCREPGTSTSTNGLTAPDGPGDFKILSFGVFAFAPHLSDLMLSVGHVAHARAISSRSVAYSNHAS